MGNWITPYGYSHGMINMYLDEFRFSIGNARKYADNADVPIESEEFKVPDKPAYFTPNRGY